MMEDGAKARKLTGKNIQISISNILATNVLASPFLCASAPLRLCVKSRPN
jgi:hypothetical protein